jgi:protein SCO1/2
MSRSDFLRLVRLLTASIWLLLMVALLVRTRIAVHAAPLPVFWQIAAWSLVDQEGATITSQDVRGKVVIANLIYTNCPDICPTILEPKMRQVQALAQANRLSPEKLVLLSLTADPTRDTPPVLASYAARFGADPRDWLFLTGDVVTVQNVVHNDFKLDFAGGTDPDSLVHDAHFLLIDQQQRVRATYDGTDVSPEDMIRDVRTLLAERAA